MFTQLPHKNAGNVSVTLTIPNSPPPPKKKYLDTQSQATELHDRANILNVGYQNTMISTPSDPQKNVLISTINVLVHCTVTMIIAESLF